GGRGMEDKRWFKKTKLLKTEDYWAIWLGLLIVVVTIGAFWAGSLFMKNIAVIPGKWKALSEIKNDCVKNWSAYLFIFLGFLVPFSLSTRIMGHKLREFIPGFVLLFIGSLGISYLAGWEFMKKWDLGSPLLALAVGLIIGNIFKIPNWFKTSLRVEYYIKT